MCPINCNNLTNYYHVIEANWHRGKEETNIGVVMVTSLVTIKE